MMVRYKLTYYKNMKFYTEIFNSLNSMKFFYRNLPNVYNYIWKVIETLPFGYNQNWATWKCPICKKVYHFNIVGFGGREYMKEFLIKHGNAHTQAEAQMTLSNTKVEHKFEVKDEMKIPQEAIAAPKAKSGLEFIRVADLGLKLAQTKEFQIVGDVEEAGTEKDRFYSVPVSYDNGRNKGQYRLNRTTLRAFVPTLGDETEKWVGARFTAFCNMVTNPKTGAQQLGLTVLVDTVKPPSK